MIKKFLSVLLICVILMSTFLTAPAHALAVEIIGGSYVAYAILAAALAAAGYTVATSQLDPDTFQAILDSSGAEDIKALITATTVFTSVNGRVFFNWSAQQWGTFLNWVNQYVATSSLVIPGSGSAILEGSLFNPSFISNYAETFIRTSNNAFGAQIGACTLVTQVPSGGMVSLRLNMQQNVYFSMANAYWYTVPPVVFVSPFLYQYTNYVGYTICVGQGMNGNNLAQSISEVTSVQESKVFELNPNQLYINGVAWTLQYQNGIIKAKQRNSSTWYNIAPTVNFTTSYTSMLQYLTDVINTGSLVGDWSGIGDDVINPADDEVQVGIDSYPNWRVGTGIDALPDSIDGSIDIPLNRYAETDLGPDVVDPYVDFTPWDTTTVPPDDVIPDTRLNPPADVTADPDTPWADDQSYPLDYPRDTTADIPADPNWQEPDENSDPNENSNRLKLGPLILSKFPFCLPWDLQHALQTLVTPGEAPSFTVPIVNERLGWNTSFTIDFGFADPLARVSRWFLSALWVVILILITRKIVWK